MFLGWTLIHALTNVNTATTGQQWEQGVVLSLKAADG
jgi:hypothetical protein